MQDLLRTSSDIDAELLPFSLDAVRVYMPWWNRKIGLNMILSLSGDNERNGSSLSSLISTVLITSLKIIVMLSGDGSLGVTENWSVNSWRTIACWALPPMATTVGTTIEIDSVGVVDHQPISVYLYRSLMMSNTAWKVIFALYLFTC